MTKTKVRLLINKFNSRVPIRPLLALIGSLFVLGAATTLANNNIDTEINGIDNRLNGLVAKGLANTLVDSLIINDFATSETAVVRSIRSQESVSSISLYHPVIGKLFTVNRNDASDEVTIDYGSVHSDNKSSSTDRRSQNNTVEQPIKNGQNIIGIIELSIAEDSVASKAASVVKANIFIAYGTSSILFLIILAFFYNDQKSNAIRKALEKKNVDLRAAKLEAEEANTYKDVLVSRVSHELRTPLNAILGTLHIINQKTADRKDLISQAYIKRIEMAANHLLEIADHILLTSKIRAGKIALNVKSHNLANLIRHCSNIIRPALSGRSISFIINVAEDVPMRIKCDELRLQQVLINLLSNAVKATESGKIIIRVFCEGSIDKSSPQICFRVEDTGHGISEQDQQRIFKPFIQLETGQSNQGTGLGLSITKNIVLAMHGTIECQSKLMEGTTFTVRIPLKSDAYGSQKISITKTKRKMVVVTSQELELFMQKIHGSLSRKHCLLTTKLRKESILKNTNFNSLVNADYILIDSTMLDDKLLSDAMKNLFSAGVFQGKILVAETIIGEKIMVDERWRIDAFFEYPLISLEFHDYFARQSSSLANADRSENKSKVSSGNHLLPGASTSHCILLVDDNQINLDVTKEILEIEGFKVETALSGDNALKILDRFKEHNRPLDLIILDIDMPHLDGFQTLDQIRKKSSWQKVPVIALTAYGDAKDISNTRDAGFYDHLVKPVDPSRMYEIIRKIIKAAPAELANTALATNLNRDSTEEDQFFELTNAGFEVDLALSRIRRRTRTYSHLINGFHDDYSSLLQHSIISTKLSDPEDWTRTVHSIKGLSGMIGATSLREACAEYEKALRNGISSDALLANFSKELKHALSAIEKTIKKNNSD